MSYTVTKDPVLSLTADAAVLCIENRMIVSDSSVCLTLAQAGDEAFRQALRSRVFLPVGSARDLGVGIPPFPRIIAAATPKWENTRGNEILIVRRCYQNVFRIAAELGCQSVVTPFLSSFYYGFPKEDAVRAAFVEARNTDLRVIFVTDSEELYRLSTQAFQKPEIVAYIGYYRDHAIFELSNGRFVRIDIRPEIVDLTLVPFFEPCYRVGNNPLQPALPESEIARLRALYDGWDWC